MMRFIGQFRRRLSSKKINEYNANPEYHHLLSGRRNSSLEDLYKEKFLRTMQDYGKLGYEWAKKSKVSAGNDGKKPFTLSTRLDNDFVHDRIHRYLSLLEPETRLSLIDEMLKKRGKSPMSEEIKESQRQNSNALLNYGFPKRASEEGMAVNTAFEDMVSVLQSYPNLKRYGGDIPPELKRLRSGLSKWERAMLPLGNVGGSLEELYDFYQDNLHGRNRE